MKTVPIITAEQAAAKVKSGDTLLAGGFGMTGNPVNLHHALAETDVKDLTFIGNNIGEDNLGGARLLRNGQVRKMIGSYFTSNKHAISLVQAGDVEYELLPQGTLAEALRAGGAGIGGFFTPASAGTLLSENRETRVIKGNEQVLIESIRGNVAFIRAWKADTCGNLVYRMTERNFNKTVATAADIVIADVQEIVPAGEISPDEIHTPSCFVDFMVESKLKPEDLGTSASSLNFRDIPDSRINMARRAYQELNAGDVVNLGIGIPTLVSEFVQEDDGIILHSENGMLGVGPRPTEGGGAMDLSLIHI